MPYYSYEARNMLEFIWNLIPVCVCDCLQERGRKDVVRATAVVVAPIV